MKDGCQGATYKSAVRASNLSGGGHGHGLGLGGRRGHRARDGHGGGHSRSNDGEDSGELHFDVVVGLVG